MQAVSLTVHTTLPKLIGAPAKSFPLTRNHNSVEGAARYAHQLGHHE